MSTYLDHNAGSPLRPEAKAAIARFMEEAGGNPASVHRAGQSARRMLEAARAQVAALIGADARQIIFTSGGTESNNLAIFGALKAHPTRRRIVTSSIEHSSILAPLAELDRVDARSSGSRPIARVGCRRTMIAASIDSDTALVTFALANSEVGTHSGSARDCRCGLARSARFSISMRRRRVGRIPVNVAELRLRSDDYQWTQAWRARRNRRALRPRRVGTDADSPRRSAGERPSRGHAEPPRCDRIWRCRGSGREHFHDEALRVSTLANELLADLFDAIPRPAPQRADSRPLPNTLNLTFPSVLGESMLIALDLEGIRRLDGFRVRGRRGRAVARAARDGPLA